jgi:hypothetical protein
MKVFQSNIPCLLFIASAGIPWPTINCNNIIIVNNALCGVLGEGLTTSNTALQTSINAASLGGLAIGSSGAVVLRRPRDYSRTRHAYRRGDGDVCKGLLHFKRKAAKPKALKKEYPNYYHDIGIAKLADGLRIETADLLYWVAKT